MPSERPRQSRPSGAGRPQGGKRPTGGKRSNGEARGGPSSGPAGSRNGRGRAGSRDSRGPGGPRSADARRSGSREERSRSRARDERPVPAPPPRRSRPPRADADVAPQRPEPEVWIDEGPERGRGAGHRSGRRPERGTTARVPKVTVRAPKLVELVGPARAKRLEDRLGTAATAFAGERFGEARQILAPIVREAPDLAEARELYGLTLYRLQRWKDAARELDAFVELSGGSTEQHPVLADCRRALRQFGEVDRLWEELREASPSGALVTEGRIVAAGSLADRGDLGGAVRLLARGFRFPKAPREHHLRRAYALADLYERSGDHPQARALFQRLVQVDPDLLDVGERLESLG